MICREPCFELIICGMPLWSFNRVPLNTKRKSGVFVITAFGTLLALIAAVSSCRLARRPPNILLITMDTTRADCLGSYGSTNGLTPSLDQLAMEGCVFARAYTVCPLTLPALASLLTGRYPFEHGVRVNGENRLPTSEITLAEVLSDCGYETAAFVGAFVLDSMFGLDQGFQLYDDDIEAPVVARQSRLLRERTADQVASPAMAWLRSRRSRPWFCWVHFFDPHYPYNSWRSAFGERFRSAPYNAEVAYMDIHIGRLLKELQRSGQDRHTLVIAVADHGESLGEHGEMQHGLTLYEAAVRVPLIMRWPGRIPRGTHVSEPVSLIDIVPTIMDLLNRPPLNIPGRSLKPLFSGKPLGGARCYLETHMPFNDYGWAPLAGVVEETWKYIHAPQPELYNLVHDSAEQQNLIDQYTNVAARLAGELEGLLARAISSESVAVHLSSSERQSLLSLGYAGGHGPAPDVSAWSDLPDIKDMLPLVQLSNNAITLLNAGRPSEALSLATDLVSRDPNNPKFKLVLATTLGAVGRTEEALSNLTDLLARGRNNLPRDVYLDATKLLALGCVLRGDRAGAEHLLREILREDPTFVEALNGLAWLLATAPEITPEQASEALKLSREAVRWTARRDASFLDTYAAAYAAAGQFQEAVAVAEEARRLAAAEGQAQLARDLSARINLYRNNDRYRMKMPDNSAMQN